MAHTVSSKYKTWQPTKPPSKGATAYHNAVIDTSWHIDNIHGLIDIAKKIIKSGDIVVDFGAGTGSSAYYLLKHLKKNFTLLLVDNSPSWLGKAHELLHTQKNVDFVLLEKFHDKYATLEEIIGKETASHVLSANTFHLIPTLKETFTGINHALKPGGTFTFQSGSIARKERKEGILIIDNTVNMVHDIAIKIIRTNDTFKQYRKGLDKRIEEELSQRKFVFPDPRPVEYYIKMLTHAGFKKIDTHFSRIKVLYKDWGNFLRVKRIQTGILPEIGGKAASAQEEEDRDKIIALATRELFDDIKSNNALANNTSFTAEWVYITAKK